MYLETTRAVRDGTWEQSFQWRGPHWEDINDETRSDAGWMTGAALEANEETAAALNDFVARLASGEVDAWTGPINLQDGTEYIPAGRVATDQEIWCLRQLLEGITGASE
jgi:simple sugar transport system substrate-binding protein